MPGIQYLIVFVGGVIVLLPFFLMAALAHDRLTRRLHDRFPDEWRNAGGPGGYFWRPPGGLLSTSLSAFIKANLKWPFRLPTALGKDVASLRDLLLLRVGLLIWNAGMIGLVAFMIARYGFPLVAR